jgi:hypothetical protein
MFFFKDVDVVRNTSCNCFLAYSLYSKDFPFSTHNATQRDKRFPHKHCSCNHGATGNNTFCHNRYQNIPTTFANTDNGLPSIGG